MGHPIVDNGVERKNNKDRRKWGQATTNGMMTAATRPTSSSATFPDWKDSEGGRKGALLTFAIALRCIGVACQILSGEDERGGAEGMRRQLSMQFWVRQIVIMLVWLTF